MKRKIGIWMAERKEKSSQRRVIDSLHFWGDIRTVVISVPDQFHDWNLLKQITETVNRKTGKTSVVYTFWIPPTLIHDVETHFPEARRITPSDLTYTRWFVPELQSARGKFGDSVDLVIDLSMDFRVDSAYLWSMFNRSYRIGFVSWRHDWFYDLVIRCQPASVPQQRIGQLKQLLESLN